MRNLGHCLKMACAISLPKDMHAQLHIKMISQDNFPALLEFLGFAKQQSIYTKIIGATCLSVDIDKQLIIYPESDGLIVNERQICNFAANENFVVFECVHRLLAKGYKPEHIELEPRWKVGHGASGGRADILIKDNLMKPLVLFECKTAGSEFKKAWNKTLNDGDQLFSYAQQISETRFLCLYSSAFEKSTLSYQSYIIAHRDNDQYLIANPLFKTFRHANNVEERFSVWRDTYKLDFTTKGIFEDNIQPYQIGKDKYSLADLYAISATNQQKKYHEFTTILRQHNVSGRENAFDKLVNLFLCKLVDEIENPNDLKFYWKGVAYDSHFDLMDRLQQLYQSGMGKFLGEDITYINQNDVSQALRFIRQNPDATQRAVWNLFIQQKFFTNNDFSFINVHNERLFYQNAEVLLKVLQMWQDICLTNPNGHSQFLGDMFEYFLDQGIKQSEGQFFTPMPICRFIVMSLPLERLVLNPEPPLAIDYACGAGHFLTELALQLQPLLEQHQPEIHPEKYHRAMFGIEKEYRLSKVAKVAAFMYGQQGIQICYGDGLVNQHDAFPAIRDGVFDLLIANPPYSVRGFLETLPNEERQAYSLTETINDPATANCIETFFVERAKQLLKSGGVAAIILPSSILSNSGLSYIRAREILLKYFDIVAIAEFGSGTFGKTGTNTVTLFLRRKLSQPDAADHYFERVNEWFKGCAANLRKQAIYNDGDLIAQYCEHINVPLADYQSLLRSEADGGWQSHEHFQPYHDKFNASTELAKLRKSKKFKALSETEQTAEIAKRYLAMVQSVERDKLYYFCLALEQTNPVLIIRSPSGSKEIKQFLGYEWSSAKGDEGIKLIEEPNGKHITALYDGPDHDNPIRFTRNNPTKLNSQIIANFEGMLGEIPPELSEVANTARLVDMLNFSRTVFEKQFSLAAKKSVEAISKWPLKKLGDITKILNGGTPDTKNPAFWDNGDICWATLVDTKEKYLKDTQKKITEEGLKATTLLPVNTVIFSSRATIGEVCINIVPTATNQGYKNFICDSRLIHHEYLYYILSYLRPFFENLVPTGSKYKEINTQEISNFKIPLPPINIQNLIFKECNLIDKKVESARSQIKRAYSDIANIVLNAENDGKLERASKLIKVNPESGEPEELFGTGYFVYLDISSVEAETGKIDFSNQLKPNDAPLRARRIVREHDILLSTVRPNLKSFAYLINLPEKILASTGFAVLRTNKDKILPKYLYYLLFGSFLQNQMIEKMGKGLYPSINTADIEHFMIPVISLTEQKQFVTKIQALEQQITDAQAIIDAAPAQKEAVMKKYL